MAAIHLDDPCGDLVPVNKGLRCAMFAHRDRRNIAQKIPQGHRLPGDDLANLIERHHRIAQCAHVSLVRRFLVPAPALEILIDEIEAFRLEFLCEQVFESTAPQKRASHCAGHPRSQKRSALGRAAKCFPRNQLNRNAPNDISDPGIHPGGRCSVRHHLLEQTTAAAVTADVADAYPPASTPAVSSADSRLSCFR